MEIFLKKRGKQMKYYKISSDRLLIVLSNIKHTIASSGTMDDCTFSRLYNDVNWLFEIGYIDASTVRSLHQQISAIYLRDIEGYRYA